MRKRGGFWKFWTFFFIEKRCEQKDSKNKLKVKAKKKETIREIEKWHKILKNWDLIVTHKNLIEFFFHIYLNLTNKEILKIYLLGSTFEKIDDSRWTSSFRSASLICFVRCWDIEIRWLTSEWKCPKYNHICKW